MGAFRDRAMHTIANFEKFLTHVSKSRNGKPRIESIVVALPK